ncbi:MAG TPA: protein kinase [Gemmataceae bacterium]|nr:protein kinase [Gemmataceae bacterium]
MQLTCPHCQQDLQFSGRRPAFCAYCGKSLPPAAEATTVGCDTSPAATDDDGADPSEIGGYRLLRPIGEGGMGRVYEAEDAGGRRVALKLISAAFAASPAAVERFRREGRLASGVSHPRCVFVLTADESGGRPYIVMELMPGTTLQDLVDREGPLPIDKAIGKILDVIEGLQEAHRLGVVHRDVKPSNCFVDAEGRVKVGDFGLSKSLAASSALTRTGTFIGTPLFASPEQIKGDAVGPRSDVYSTAATLYCLLTGKAPFQGGDPAATLARIVCDPAPPMRSRRRELPEALDQAVLRGLERDPAKRWRDLDEFRSALLPFVPGRLSVVIGGLGPRFAAYLIDAVLLWIAGILLSFILGLCRVDRLLVGMAPLGRAAVQHVQDVAPWLLYFAVPEAIWGCAVGKFCLRLRVGRADANRRPTLIRSVIRTVLTYIFLCLGYLGSQAIIQVSPAESPDANIIQSCFVSLTLVLGTAAGVGLLLCPMRTRNGFRGLHEWLSGTRVIRLPDPPSRRRRTLHDRQMESSRPEGMPERLGPFEVMGALPGAAMGTLLIGRDAALGRRAWIWLRPADAPPFSPTRHAVSRTARQRWLAGGRDGPHQWDAFLAPTGVPLADAAADMPLTWAEARLLLAQLAEELELAGADGTLPPTLTTDQVWVHADGKVQLLEVAPAPAAAGGASPLGLLRQAAVLTLEGRPRAAGARPTSIRAPLPLYAARLLDRLLGIGPPWHEPPYRDLRAFRADLAAVADRPAQTTRSRRFAHGIVLSLLLAFGLFGSLGMAGALFLSTPFLLSQKVAERQELQKRLHGVIAEDAAASLNPDLGLRLAALRQAQEDARLDDDLNRIIERARSERDSMVRSMNEPSRSIITVYDEQMEAAQRKQVNDDIQYAQFPLLPGVGEPEQVRQWAAGETAIDRPMVGAVTRMMALVQIICILLWPAIWVVWALAFRGGLGLQLMGLGLMRSDGRPATRLQCAWRALLFWTPILGLSLAAVVLNWVHWARWPGDESAALLTASSVTWWAALGLLPLYLALAICFPRQGPHDWLAGTYVVPR